MRALLMIALMPLAGCTIPLNTRGVCDAGRVQGFVGQVYNDSIAGRIKDRSLAVKARTLRPGDVTTMEFNNKRVNIAVDDNNRVTRIYCG
ncbi:I78 family peptidase inhibitor [uncultured Sphingomonas sp.]|uniref:I78 family peptidase inhibitor n=1 Tax=uncultured Sphingomonas sp. TaxID=158754 RepID=UPI0025CEA206|nr:I78 family peptidase inhibitor [uncultured Sphingomonas sp.]